MNHRIEATIDSLSKLIDIFDNATSGVNKMFSGIDKNQSLNIKIDQAEVILDEFIKSVGLKISETDVDESLQKAAILSFTNHIEKAFYSFIAECENKQLPALFVNRYDSEDAFNGALGGDIEMCYLVSKYNKQLSSSEKIKILTFAAEAGHPESCNDLSIQYSLGIDVTANTSQSEEWADKSYELFHKQSEMSIEFKEYLQRNFEDDPDNILEKIISWAVRTQSTTKDFIADRVIANAYESAFLSFPATIASYSSIIQNLGSIYGMGIGVATNEAKKDAFNNLADLCHKLNNYKYTKDITSDYSDTLEKIKFINKKIISIQF